MYENNCNVMIFENETIKFIVHVVQRVASLGQIHARPTDWRVNKIGNGFNWTRHCNVIDAYNDDRWFYTKNIKLEKVFICLLLLLFIIRVQRNEIKLLTPKLNWRLFFTVWFNSQHGKFPVQINISLFDRTQWFIDSQCDVN